MPIRNGQDAVYSDMRLMIVAIICGLAASAADVALTPAGLDSGKVKVEAATYKGKAAIHFVEQGEYVAIAKNTDFHNGTLEVDIAAKPASGAIEGARGFAGLAFRVKDRTHYEAFYLRPTNGRADDQLRRNHSTQYISEPEWPWEKLRGETPGVYESYVDLEPDVWTHVRIVVKGTRAELFVGAAAQPCLIVKELKKGDSRGPVALWIGAGTDAHFANLKITAAE
jgi:hypothetical protein